MIGFGILTGDRRFPWRNLMLSQKYQNAQNKKRQRKTREAEEGGKVLNRASLQREDRPEKIMKYAEYNGNRLNREYGVRKSSRTSDYPIAYRLD